MGSGDVGKQGRNGELWKEKGGVRNDDGPMWGEGFGEGKVISLNWEKMRGILNSSKTYKVTHQLDVRVDEVWDERDGRYRGATKV